MTRLNRFVFGIMLFGVGSILLSFYKKPEFEGVTSKHGSLNQIPDKDYLPVIQAHIAAENYGTAISMIDYVTYHHLPNRLKIIQLRTDAENKKAEKEAVVKNLVTGFYKGEGEGLSSDLGSLAGDMLIWGDFRDGGKEVIKIIKGEEVDEFSLALSLVGIGTSVAALFPPSIEVGIPADVACSTLKGLKRTGALSDEFADSVKILFKEARETKKLGGLTNVFADLLTIKKNCPTDFFPTLMKQVRSPDDLKRVAIVISEFPNETVMLFDQAGDDGMKIFRLFDEEYNPDFWKNILKKGKAGLEFVFNNRRLKKDIEELLKDNSDTGESSNLARPVLEKGAINQIRYWFVHRPRLRQYILGVGSLFMGCASLNFIKTCFVGNEKRKR